MVTLHYPSGNQGAISEAIADEIRRAGIHYHAEEFFKTLVERFKHLPPDMEPWKVLEDLRTRFTPNRLAS